jgi:hypothetical protein
MALCLQQLHKRLKQLLIRLRRVEVAARYAVEEGEIRRCVFLCGRLAAGGQSVSQSVGCIAPPPSLRGGTYRSSTKYGAALNEARSATLTVGPARTHNCVAALSSSPWSARIAPKET